MGTFCEILYLRHRPFPQHLALLPKLLCALIVKLVCQHVHTSLLFCCMRAQSRISPLWRTMLGGLSCPRRLVKGSTSLLPPVTLTRRRPYCLAALTNSLDVSGPSNPQAAYAQAIWVSDLISLASAVFYSRLSVWAAQCV